jgi:hypothetical protein
MGGVSVEVAAAAAAAAESPSLSNLSNLVSTASCTQIERSAVAFGSPDAMLTEGADGEGMAPPEGRLCQSWPEGVGDFKGVGDFGGDECFCMSQRDCAAKNISGSCTSFGLDMVDKHDNFHNLYIRCWIDFG